jgi:hypothetical protein
MRAIFIGIVLSFLSLNCAVAADAAQLPLDGVRQTAPRSEVPPALLRYQLEQVYRAVRAALESRDYAAFQRLVIPARSGKPPPQAAFDKVALNLLDDYPVLEQLDFVKVEQSGDWAGYYAEDRVADMSRTYILFFRFKRGPQGWRISGRVVAHDIARVSGQYRTLDEIALNPIFRLPGQRGYRERAQ